MNNEGDFNHPLFYCENLRKPIGFIKIKVHRHKELLRWEFLKNYNKGN